MAVLFNKQGEKLIELQGPSTNHWVLQSFRWFKSKILIGCFVYSFIEACRHDRMSEPHSIHDQRGDRESRAAHKLEIEITSKTDCETLIIFRSNSVIYLNRVCR